MKILKVTSSLWIGLVLLICLVVSGPVVAAKSQNLGGLELEEVAPRIVTPNGDLLNDKIFFKFRPSDSLLGIPVESAVFDINGAKIADLILDPNDDSRLTWDARDNSGQVVPAGIYVYSIKIGKNFATGTVVVAR